jgi:hypothetical protein
MFFLMKGVQKKNYCRELDTSQNKMYSTFDETFFLLLFVIGFEIQQCLKIALENLKPVKIHRRTMSNIHEKNDSPRSIRSRSMFSGWSSKAEIIPFIE